MTDIIIPTTVQVIQHRDLSLEIVEEEKTIDENINSIKRIINITLEMREWEEYLDLEPTEKRKYIKNRVLEIIK